jgi:hypothetical protein
MELKEVIPGQKVVYDGFLNSAAGAFGCADDLGNYLGRVNYPSATNSNPETGHYEFVIPAGVYKIGIYIDTRTVSNPEAATVTIGEQKVSVKTDLLDIEEIGNRLNIQGNERLLASQTDFYQRGASPKVYVPANKKVCIIVAGQSNTDGRVPATQFPVSYLDENGKTVNYLDENGQIQNTMYCKNSLPAALGTWTLGTNLWAYDAIVLSRLQHYLNDTVYEIKTSRGGTAIDPLGTNGGGYWTPRFENIPSGQHLTSNFERSIRTAITNNPNAFDIKAFLWHQGEGDSPVLAGKKYYQNLIEVIDYERVVVGNPTLPFIFGSISHISSQYNEDVEAAMLKIANQDKYVYLVDMSAGTLLDAYHFDATSSEYLGTKMYEILRDNIL